MAKPRSKRLSKAEKRRLIRHAAYRCFVESGYHAATVDRICESANISKGSFYWYFSSKQSIFLDILNNWADEVASELSEQFEPAINNEDRFAAFSVTLEREARRVRAIMPVWLDFLSQMGRDPDVREGLARFHRRIRSIITELFRTMIPGLDEAHLEAVAAVVLAGFTGLVWQDLADPSGARFSQHCQCTLAILRALVESADSETLPRLVPVTQVS